MRNDIKLSVRMICAAMIVLLSAATAGASVYAWFYVRRVARSDDMLIDLPPVIYVKDDSLGEMTSFNLDGLQINEDYTAVFCVSPVQKGVVEKFDLAVIYTENIGMVIDLYEVSNITETPEETSETDQKTKSVFRSVTLGTETVGCYFNYASSAMQAKTTYGGWESETPATGDLNQGVYKLYSDLKFGTATGNKTTVYDRLNDTELYRFFVLNVTWKEDIDATAAEKEVDVVYIVAKGTGKQ